MRDHTKMLLDNAVGHLKRDGYQVLVIMMERSANDEPMKAMEVLCSETANPFILAEMAREALEGLSQSAGAGPREDLAN